MSLCMSSQSEQLKARTRAFAVQTLRLIDKLPRTTAAQVIARQLAKSATSVGANYRACCNVRSKSEFIAKLGIVVEESEESLYWLELIGDARLLQPSEAAAMRSEALELRSIFARSLGTARSNQKMNQSMTR